MTKMFCISVGGEAGPNEHAVAMVPIIIVIDGEIDAQDLFRGELLDA